MYQVTREIDNYVRIHTHIHNYKYLRCSLTFKETLLTSVLTLDTSRPGCSVSHLWAFMSITWYEYSYEHRFCVINYVRECSVGNTPHHFPPAIPPWILTWRQERPLTLELEDPCPYPRSDIHFSGFSGYSKHCKGFTSLKYFSIHSLFSYIHISHKRSIWIPFLGHVLSLLLALSLLPLSVSFSLSLPPPHSPSLCLSLCLPLFPSTLSSIYTFFFPGF